MLERIHIDNYKCLTNFDLRLDNLTRLAGANGCGKSAVFEVVGKLRDFACDWRVDKLFSADDLTRWTTKREQRFELEFSTDRGAFLYKLVIEHQPDDRGVEVKSERLVHDGTPVLSSCDRKLQLYRDDGSEGHAYPFGRTVPLWRRNPTNTSIRVCICFAVYCPIFRRSLWPLWPQTRLTADRRVNPTC